MSIFLRVVLLLLLAGSGEQLDLEAAAGMLSSQLEDIFNETAFTVLQGHTTDLLGGRPSRKLNGSEVASLIAQRLSDDVTEIEAILKETVAMAGQLYSDNLGIGCCSDLCDRQSDSHDRDACSEECVAPGYCQAEYGSETACIGTEPREQSVFDRLVSFDESAVHIPVNIFENDTSVLCFVQWTDNLTAHFQDNRNRASDPALVTSQFLGSSSGILRFFPASDWALINQCERCPFEPVDTYDARRRPWFLNTVAGSKFVVILLDLSGSVSGFQLLLAQLAANELLQSLNEEDFFFVIRVGDNATRGPLGCFTGRTRASPENVLAMNKVIMVTNNTHGRADFGPALDHAFREFEASSECQQILVIFTDGDRETVVPTEPFQRYNQSRRVRVFSYLIGRGSDDANLELVARCNRGNMSRIREYDDIISKIRVLTNELRPETLPLPEDSRAFWTRYRDVFGDLVLTASLPVIRETNESREFVGVLGMDVNPQLMDLRIREHVLGPGSYGFVIDNNGQVIAHPHISKEHVTSLSADDLLSLDISNFEHSDPSDAFDQVRRAMIDRTTGDLSLTAWVTVQREQRYLLRNVTYHYAPIEGTPFSIALVLPSPEALLLDYPPFNLSLSALNLTQKEISLEKRPYCQLDFDPSANPTQFLNHLISSLSASTSLQDCNELLYRPLLSDLWLVNQELPRLRNVHVEARNISGVFAQFSSGLTVCFSEGFSCQDLPYLRLAAGTGDRLSLYASGYSNTSAVAIRALSAASEEGVVSTVGVVGAVLSAAALTELLEDAAVQADVLYLVDSSGYVVASTEECNVSKLLPLAEVQPEVASELVGGGVFVAAELRSYELRVCGLAKQRAELKESAGASSILSYTGLAETPEATCETVPFCLLQTAAWQLSEDGLPARGNVTSNCTGEEIQYGGALVPSTNLLLLAVHNSCNCAVTTDTQQEHALCSCDETDRYRRGRSSSCYSNSMNSSLPAGCSSALPFLRPHFHSIVVCMALLFSAVLAS